MTILHMQILPYIFKYKNALITCVTKLFWGALPVMLYIQISLAHGDVLLAKDDNAPPTTDVKCTQYDYDYAKKWGYYDPEEAYEFGLKIQNIFKEKNMKALFEQVNGELQNGPRRAFARAQPFDQIFAKQWVADILSAKPLCAPVGSYGGYGFALAGGMIEYDYEPHKKKWYITSIYGARIENDLIIPPWQVKNKILGVDCFAFEWVSSDNFEAYQSTFNIKNYADFSKFTGAFFGREITHYAPIKPSWYTQKGDEISLINNLKSCMVKKNDITINDNIVTQIQEKHFPDDPSLEKAYKILAKISPARCSALAPNIGTKCIESRVIWIGRDTGGTFGWDDAYGVYGVFNLPDLKLSVVPLRFFQNRNEALNFANNK